MNDVVWVAAPLWSGPVGFQRKVLGTGEPCKLVGMCGAQVILQCARDRWVKADSSCVRRAR